MKRCILFSIMFLCLILISFAQQPAKKSNSPKEDVRVNREYDEQGNLIKFDSLYSYSWSSDTTLTKSLSPKDFPFHFDPNSGFFNDSTFSGNSFFDGFDQPFAQPFSGKQDSLLMKKFGSNHPFNFRFNTDSMASNLNDFDDFFNYFGDNKDDNKGDSISSNLPKHAPHFSQPKSMDEMMKMFQQQMQEMEEYQRKLFKEQPKTNEQ